jgi:hypothetical protein
MKTNQLSIYDVYVKVTDQEQADRLKQVCLVNGLPIWDDEEAFLADNWHDIVAFTYVSESKQFYVINPYNGLKWFEKNRKTEILESEFIELIKQEKR